MPMTMPSSVFRALTFRAALLSAVLVAPLSAVAQARTQSSTAAAEPQSAPITNVRYAVTFNTQTARNRTIIVAMTFDVTGAAPVLLSLPAWTPGAYELSNFARNIYEF